MNWGNKIFIFIVFFIVAMLGMVYVASKQDNQMMDEQYYDRELKFQTQIDAQKELNLASNSPICTQVDKNIQIKLPDSLHQAISDASIEIIRPSEQANDIRMSLTPDANGIQNLPLEKFINGKYIVRVKWSNAGKNYFKEEFIFVNK